MAIEGAAIVLLAILVAGLLRSHAEIIRALHDLSVGGGPGSTSTSLPMPTVAATGAQAADVGGITPAEDPVVVGVNGRATLLAFLSTGCSSCKALWAGLADGRDGAGLSVPARVVVVTKGPSEESPAAVRDLAPDGVPVVMSEDAWADYEVPGVPFFVLVGPDGEIAGRGVANSLDQLRSLLDQALGDVELPSTPRKARADEWREQRADRDLMAAGIRPGDPRLHPAPGSRAGE
ncbi:MAG: hypothetical protein JWP02_1866 [Acidimicrobiales bacterium]|nr:hypothetical protein [Acidimicrobiales bacterium]